MKRLPDQFDATDPNEVYAASLLAHVRPLAPSPMRKRRVWVALQRLATKRPKNRVSVAVVAGVVLCGATAASATMTHLWNRFQRASTDVPAASTPMAPPPHPTSPIAPLAVPSPTIRHVDPLPAPKQMPSKSRGAAVDLADPASAALMVQAMHARRASHFARVWELSTEYRLKYPDGALHEEALALSIEAASALGEEEASRLAAIYLQRYPRGRFRGQAQRALGSAR